ncbi:MAG: YceI family protein [Acidobacteria bacterium]|nr:YceI family protein [Acidobacteriota bacterium]
MSRLLARFLTAVLVACALVAPLVFAGTYDVDRSHSSVVFSIRHFVSQVQGRFGEFQGALVYDEANPSASSVEFTVQTASIDTDNAKRDDHLRSTDFFDAEKNPTISFRSTKVAADGKDGLLVTGDLTLKGVTKSVTVPVKVLGVMDAGKMGRRAGFAGTFTVNRKDYGITWNRALDQGGFLLGDDVAITVNIEAAAKPAEAAAK